MKLTYSFTGAKSSEASLKNRAVLLAHGAGADRNAPALVAVSKALAAAGIPSLRFDYPYRTQGRNAPDRPAVLLEATREAAAKLSKRTGLAPERCILGGRSMGGRICSMITSDPDDPLASLGLLLLAYPLHPAGHPEKSRTEHLQRISVPVLFVSGTRDALASKKDLSKAAKAIKGPVNFHWIEGGDHGFKVLKSIGTTPAQVMAEVAGVSVAWVKALR